MHSNEPARNKGLMERSMCRTWAFYNEMEKNGELLLQLVHLNWKFCIYLSVHYVPSIIDAEYKPCGLKIVYFFKLSAVFYLCWLHQNFQQQALMRISNWHKGRFQCGCDWRDVFKEMGQLWLVTFTHNHSEVHKTVPSVFIKDDHDPIHSYCVTLLSLTAMLRD